LTSFGTKTIISGSAFFLPKNITLLHPWEIRGTINHIKNLNLKIKTAHATFMLEDIDLHWQPLSLIHRQLNVQSLHATKLLIQKNPGISTQKVTSKTTTTIIPMAIQHLTIEEVIINKRYQMGTLAAKLMLNPNGQLKVTADIKRNRVATKVNGRLSLSQPHPIAAILTPSIKHANWQLDLPIKITGTLSHYKIAIDGTLSHQKQQIASIKASAKGSSTALKNVSILTQFKHGELSGHFDFSWKSGFHWQGSLLGNVTPAALLPASTLSLHPSLASLFDLKERTFQLKAKGQYNQTTHVWHNTLMALSFSPKNQKGWTLTKAIAIPYPLPTTSTPRLCLDHDTQHFCLSVNKTRHKTTFSLQSNAIDLSLLSPPKSQLSLQGSMTINAQLQQQKGKWLGTAAINLHQIKLNQPKAGPDSLQNSVFIQQGKLTLHYQSGLLRSNLSLTQSAKNSVNAAMLYTFAKPSEKASIDASANLNFTDLSVFEPIVPALFDLKGVLVGNIRLFGSLTHPDYQGNLHLGKLTTLIPNLGLMIKNSNIDILNPKNNHFSIKGLIKAQKGSLTLDGNLTLTDFKPSLTLHLNGDHFSLIDLPNTYALVSPNLFITAMPSQTKLTGTILLNQANISPASFKINSTTDADIRYVHQPQSKAMNLSEKLKLKMGKSVHFKGYGINSMVHGTLHLARPNSNSPLLATGILTSGKKNAYYETHGKHFTIQKGQLIFAKSPLSNPRLNITAVYQMPPSKAITATENITLGVNVLGTLSQPQLELFSNPSMSEGDIFSYIVLGKPLSAVNDNSKSSLSQAAALFALNGGSQHVVDTIRTTFGLSELSLGTLDDSDLSDTQKSQHATDDSATKNVAIFLGKNLTPWLYLSYGKGLFNRKQMVQAKLSLSHHIELRGDVAWQGSENLHNQGTDLDTGADIFYRIERN